MRGSDPFLAWRLAATCGAENASRPLRPLRSQREPALPPVSIPALILRLGATRLRLRGTTLSATACRPPSPPSTPTSPRSATPLDALPRVGPAHAPSSSPGSEAAHLRRRPLALLLTDSTPLLLVATGRCTARRRGLPPPSAVGRAGTTLHARQANSEMPPASAAPTPFCFMFQRRWGRTTILVLLAAAALQLVSERASGESNAKRAAACHLWAGLQLATRPRPSLLILGKPAAAHQPERESASSGGLGLG